LRRPQIYLLCSLALAFFPPYKGGFSGKQKQNPISQREMGFCFLMDRKVMIIGKNGREDYFVKVKDPNSIPGGKNKLCNENNNVPLLH
jgi:hypothetical protein